MSLHRFAFLTAEEIVSHLPTHGHAALPERGRDLTEGTGEPPPHAGPGGTRDQQSGADQRAHYRAGLALGTAARAREANRVRGGCFRHPPWFPEPRSPAAKLLNILAQSADSSGATLASLVPLATVPRPISSGFPRVFDPHNLTQQRAADAPLSTALSTAWSIELARSSAAGARGFGQVFGWSTCGLDQRRGLAGGTGSSPPVLAARAGEGCSMSGWNPLGPDPDELVARVLQRLRDDGLLPQRRPVEPPNPAGPTRGPRKCPQRNRYKRVLKGPRARRPLHSGQHPPSLRTPLTSRSGERAWQENMEVVK